MPAITSLRGEHIPQFCVLCARGRRKLPLHEKSKRCGWSWKSLVVLSSLWLLLLRYAVVVRRMRNGIE